jgi:hypothetical protein
MLDFSVIQEDGNGFNELVADLSLSDLENLTNEMIDFILDQVADCEDIDVTFEPSDPEEDVDLAWNLGHVIVHVTASSEESAALAVELARGVRHHGRSRYETPWETVETMDQCRQRLEESRRMRLASLQMWPDDPKLDNTYRAWTNGPQVNALGRFILGLWHTDDHLGQIEDIVRQAKAARS